MRIVVWKSPKALRGLLRSPHEEVQVFAAELLKGISAGLAGTGYELLAHAGSTDVHSRSGWERRSLSRLGRTLPPSFGYVCEQYRSTSHG